MLRSLYGWVIRLHPRRFRERFGSEMLAIFDESGADRAVFRLLLDGAVSLARQWALRSSSVGAKIAEAVPWSSDGAPAFYLFGDYRRRTSSVASGGVLTLFVFCVAYFACEYAWTHPVFMPLMSIQFETGRDLKATRQSSSSPLPLQATAASPKEINSARSGPKRVPSSFEAAPAQFGKHSVPQADISVPVSQRETDPPELAASEATHATRTAAGHSVRSSEHAATVPAKSRHPYANDDAHSAPQAKQNAGTASGAALSAFNRDARHRILSRAVADLDQYYVDRTVARRTGRAVLAHEAKGDDERAADPAAFARLVTQQMRAASGDHDLELVYSAEPLPVFSTPLAPSAQPVSAAYRAAMLHSNCGFAKIQLLPHNIGYVKLDSFPELSVCRQKAVAAMSEINDAKAVIFDLRENRGGFGNMTAFIASYLFDHPEYWYSPRDNTSKESWLRSPVARSKLAATPVYILTSRQTISAAEQFTYNLKMLKRATIVGETTAGGAHAGVFHRIDDHFGIAITEVKSINPYSKYDWNGSGIEPDVKTPAAGALKAAIGLIDKDDRRK